mmetsp:Transcript_95127/g.268757  ORF Transcript_95127/g.268757 Transcript_95127/m.268757 type:complete len:282 (-) Transcript_95127:2-847(-)
MLPYSGWWATCALSGCGIAAFSLRIFSRSSRLMTTLPAFGLPKPLGAFGLTPGTTPPPKPQGAFGFTTPATPPPKAFGAKGLLATAGAFMAPKGLLGGAATFPASPASPSAPLAVAGASGGGAPNGIIGGGAATFLLAPRRAAYGFGGAQRASAALISFFASGGDGPLSPTLSASAPSGFFVIAVGGGASASSSFSSSSLPRSRQRPFSLSNHMAFCSPRFARVAFGAPSSSFFFHSRDNILLRLCAAPWGKVQCYAPTRRRGALPLTRARGQNSRLIPEP